MVRQAQLKRFPVDDKGFTLVELLIVVAIIAILATIAIPQYIRYTERANRAGMLSDAKNIAHMLEIYYGDHSTYVTTVTSIGPGPASGSLDGGTDYIIRASKFNTVNLVETVSTYSVVISNPAAGVGKSPLTLTSTGGCSWADSSGC